MEQTSPQYDRLQVGIKCFEWVIDFLHFQRTEWLGWSDIRCSLTKLKNAWQVKLFFMRNFCIKPTEKIVGRIKIGANSGKN